MCFKNVNEIDTTGLLEFLNKGLDAVNACSFSTLTTTQKEIVLKKEANEWTIFSEKDQIKRLLKNKDLIAKYTSKPHPK